MIATFLPHRASFWAQALLNGDSKTAFLHHNSDTVT